MKKLFRFLQLFDAIWSLPAMFGAFCLVGYLLPTIFGYSTGSYDPAFLQPLFLAITILIGAANAGLGFLFFFARGLFRYWYDKGVCHRSSKHDWWQLKPLQRVVIFLAVLFTMILLVIFVYLKLV